MTVGRARTGPRHGPRARSPRRGRLGTQGGRAAFIGTGPTAWWDARDLLATTQTTLTSRVGSGTATLTNGPLAFPNSGYVYFPGVTGNVLTIPDAAAVDVVGDLEIVCRVALTDWTPASFSILLSKGNSAFELAVSSGSTGTLNLVINAGNNVSTVATGHTDGTTYWIKATHRKSDGRIQFFTAADQATEPTSWTQLGGDVTGPTAATANSVNPLTCGGRGNGSTQVMTGVGYRWILRDGIDGTKVADINPTVETLGQATWTATTGQTVTVNRAGTGHVTTVVARPTIALDGTNDYIQLPAGNIPTFTATTGTHTALVVARNRALAASGTLWSSESASDVGANLFLTASGVVTARVGGATTTADATVGTGHDDDVTLNAFGFVYATGTVRAYRYGDTISAATDTTGVGTVTHAAAPRIGSRADSVALPNRAGLMAVALWDRALTQAELDIASAYLTGSYV